MLNFISLFKNHFNNEKISDDNLHKYTDDHIGRIIAHNGGGTYNSILAATSTANTAYFGSISSEDIAFAVQQSLTNSVDKIIGDFKKDASKYEGAVRSAYGKDSGKYQEFYPLGITEYSDATKANVKTLMTRLDVAFAAHAADFAAGVVTLFHDYPINFETGRSAQLSKIGEVSTKKVGTAEGRDELEVQLLKNLFFIGFTNPGNVDLCMSFVNQSILRSDVNSDNDGKGQVQGIARLAGLPVADVEFQFSGVAVNKFHSKEDGNYRSPKVPANATYTLVAKKAGLKTKAVTLTIEDAGIGHVDFDMETE